MRNQNEIFGSNVAPKKRKLKKHLHWLCLCPDPEQPAAMKLNRPEFTRCTRCGRGRDPR